MPFRHSSRYVNGPKGLRLFFFALAIACFCGLAFRLYLNPIRIKSWLDHAMDGHGAQLGFQFHGASLRLARGSMPQLAIELSGVSLNPAKDCRTEPSVRIATLTLPLSFTNLVRGRVAIGTVAANDLEVDLDGLKARCEQRREAKRRETANVRPAQTAHESAAVTNAGTGKAEPWWNGEQVAAFQEVVGGFEFSRVQVFFENKTKKVYLDDLSLVPGPRPGSIVVETALIIPPELTYGEQLPPLRISGIANPTGANANVRAGLSEGGLLVEARLKPLPNQQLDADLKASVSGVPLSTLVPLMTKSSIVNGEFRPKFMWMSCQAAIRGRFQGLFSENSLRLDGCEIQGNGALIRAEHAVRKPDGTWEPFEIDLKNVGLNQVLETFAWQGPDGVFSEYGRLNGKVRLNENRSAGFSGDVRGAQVRFSHRSVRADQKINRMAAKIDLVDGRINGTLSDLDFDGGEFRGGFSVRLEKHATEGNVEAEIKSMRLNEGVQRVLVNGQLEEISGRAVARLEGGKLAALTGKLKVSGLAGRDLRLKEASLETALGQNGEFVVGVKAPEIEVHQNSAFFRSVRQIFFSHVFTGEWVSIHAPVITARIGSAGGLRWESAQASLENGKIRLLSSGEFSRDYSLDGWVSVDFPSVHKLKWKLGGRLDAPSFSEESKTLLDLRGQPVDDAKLGLPVKKTALDIDLGTVANKTKESLRALRERVMRGAKNIVPADKTESSKTISD